MNLSSTFGMVEMEQAAISLIKRFNEYGDRSLTIENFKNNLIGFSELAAYGWIIPMKEGENVNALTRSKGVWFVTQALLERVKSHHPEALTRDIE